MDAPNSRNSILRQACKGVGLGRYSNAHTTSHRARRRRRDVVIGTGRDEGRRLTGEPRSQQSGKRQR